MTRATNPPKQANITVRTIRKSLAPPLSVLGARPEGVGLTTGASPLNGDGATPASYQSPVAGGTSSGEISVSRIACKVTFANWSNCLELITQRIRYWMSVLATETLTL